MDRFYEISKSVLEVIVIKLLQVAEKQKRGNIANNDDSLDFGLISIKVNNEMLLKNV